MTDSERSLRLVDVAEAAGVSLATASRSMAGRDGVSTSVAAHVRAVAASLGYIPNAHARALAGSAQPMVGLIVHDVSDPYFAEIARGLLRVAEERGMMVLINQSERSSDTELARIRTLRAQQVGAIVLAGSGYVEPELEADATAELRGHIESGGRAALVGRHHIPVDAVLPANRPGGATAAAHLAELGHRRIAVIAGDPRLCTVADRLAGVRAGAKKAGLDPGAVVVLESAFSREGGAQAAHRLRTEYPDVTGVVALSDVMAMGALSELRSAGVSVPGDVSLVGFDDVTVAADLAPALTTIRLPMAEMGALALEMTFGPRAEKPRRRRTSHTLVVRDSTAPPRR
ncbi:LacI family transcriptional regulator [Murinocardiopsis flavida]|uniref:LacI family transcriptional regulator n=1 Tax=Murinocardiopsis flavida TaxID=645275 RepID=A0A2P8DSU6_9ACTN|nr:LacI family DNA-binding transcriptional regulator [Murinocardiopsis flavida]PSL00284.1 LacI family transcriptional regulator [Murinocardiopsis flavida]